MGLLAGILPIGIGLVVAFLGQAFLARIVGPETFGVYIYALTWASSAALLAKGGQEWALFKVVPICIRESAWGQIRFTVERAFIAVAWRAGLFAALLAVVSVATGRVPNQSILAATVALVIVLALAEMRRSWALAHRAIWLSDAPESIIKSLLLLALAWAMVKSEQSINPATLLWINAAATGVTALAATAVFLWLVAPNLLCVVAEPVDTSDHDSVSRGMWLSTAANILLRSADLIVVGLVTDATTTGIYAIASRIASLAAVPNMILSRVAAPLMSVATGSADLDEVRRISRGYVALTTAASVFIFVFILMAGGPAIRLLFGPAYSDAETATKILLLGHVAISLIGPANLLLALAGGHMPSALISVCSAVIGLFLLAILTPAYGTIGAATATSLALVFKSFVSAIWVRVKLGVDTSFFAMRRNK